MVNLENGKLYLSRTWAGEYILGELEDDSLVNAIMIIPNPEGNSIKFNFFPVWGFFGDQELQVINNIKAQTMSFKLLGELELLNKKYYEFRVQRFGASTGIIS